MAPASLLPSARRAPTPRRSNLPPGLRSAVPCPGFRLKPIHPGPIGDPQPGKARSSPIKGTCSAGEGRPCYQGQVLACKKGVFRARRTVNVYCTRHGAQTRRSEGPHPGKGSPAGSLPLKSGQPAKKGLTHPHWAPESRRRDHADPWTQTLEGGEAPGSNALIKAPGCDSQ